MTEPEALKETQLRHGREAGPRRAYAAPLLQVIEVKTSRSQLNTSDLGVCTLHVHAGAC